MVETLNFSDESEVLKQVWHSSANRRKKKEERKELRKEEGTNTQKK